MSGNDTESEVGSRDSARQLTREDSTPDVISSRILSVLRAPQERAGYARLAQQATNAVLATFELDALSQWMTASLARPRYDPLPIVQSFCLAATAPLRQQLAELIEVFAVQALVSPNCSGVAVEDFRAAS